MIRARFSFVNKKVLKKERMNNKNDNVLFSLLEEPDIFSCYEKYRLRSLLTLTDRCAAFICRRSLPLSVFPFNTSVFHSFQISVSLQKGSSINDVTLRVLRGKANS